MRFSKSNAFIVACCSLVAAHALSLFDTAPVVGLPESHAVKYSASVRVGYDDNMYCEPKPVEGEYVGANVRATFADYESVDKLSYDLKLGFTRYFKDSENISIYHDESRSRKLYSDCSLSASITHAFSSRSTYTVQVMVSYMPEPDYANAISSSRRQGDVLNWSLSNAYSEAIDSRWSWGANASYSGNLYGESANAYDDRQYVGCGGSLSYRESQLVTYNVSLDYRYDMRDFGYNASNFILSTGASMALDPVSSMHIQLGVQNKYIRNEAVWSPNIRAGYNRRVTEGVSVRAYLSLANENVDTYSFAGNYLSDLALRAGVNCVYRLSPDVSFVCGIAFIRSSYSRGTDRLADYDTYTFTPSVEMRYKFAQDLEGSIRYAYSTSDRDGTTADYSYDRNNISASLKYTF